MKVRPKMDWKKFALTIGITTLILSISASSWAVNTSTLFTDFLSSHDIARKVFRGLQRQNLSQDAENTIYSLFAQDPVLADIFTNDVAELNKASVDNFRLSAETSMFRWNNQTREMRFLMSLAKKTAGDLGFSKSAVNNLTIYTSPSDDANAFTVSADENRIVAVVNYGLLTRMTAGQVRAVLAHEFGHILSEHTHQKLLLNLMFEMIGSGEDGLVLGDMKALKESTLAALGSTCAHSGHHHSVSQNQTTVLERKILGILAGISRKMNSLGTEQVLELKSRFIGYLITALSLGNSPTEVMAYFYDLARQLNSSVRIDQEQFEFRVEQAQLVLSSQMERSADKFASSVTPNETLALTFARLGGAIFSDGEAKEAIAGLIQQAEDNRKEYDPETLKLATLGSHPRLHIRIEEIMKLNPFPELLFANPFLRMIIAYAELEGLRSLLTSQKSDEAPKVEAAVKELRSIIVDRIESLEPSKRGQNSRLENLLQYYLYLVELQTEMRSQFAAQIATYPNAELRSEIEKNWSWVNDRYVQEIGILTEFIRQLKSRMDSSSSSERSYSESSRNRLARALAAKSLDDVKSLRAEITASSNGKFRKSRLPLEINIPENQRVPTCPDFLRTNID
ncbi:MAG: M48 family metalloprotease [Bdellovibrionales bacterium]|nr:M48 family metalloprotease [Bdellovibrionales bacterium]